MSSPAEPLQEVGIAFASRRRQFANLFFVKATGCSLRDDPSRGFLFAHAISSFSCHFEWRDCGDRLLKCAPLKS